MGVWSFPLAKCQLKFDVYISRHSTVKCYWEVSMLNKHQFDIRRYLMQYWLNKISRCKDDLHVKFFSIHVMQSREISLKSNMWHSQFSSWLKCSFGKEDRTWIGPVVPKLWAVEGSQNSRKQKKFIPFSGYHVAINVPDFRLIPLYCDT